MLSISRERFSHNSRGGGRSFVATRYKDKSFAHFIFTVYISHKIDTLKTDPERATTTKNPPLVLMNV